MYFDFNGMPRSVKINDRTAQSTRVVRSKAADVPGGVGAPMPGVVVDMLVKVGDAVEVGAPTLTLTLTLTLTPTPTLTLTLTLTRKGRRRWVRAPQ